MSVEDEDAVSCVDDGAGGLHILNLLVFSRQGYLPSQGKPPQIQVLEVCSMEMPARGLDHDGKVPTVRLIAYFI